MKILLAEDDRRLGSMIKDYLMPESELMQVVNTGSQIKDEIATNDYDILILDVMLPEKNGIDICRELRAENIEIAILFITALNNQNDKIKAFQSGADDYLIKPFELRELLARVRALIRRSQVSPPEPLSPAPIQPLQSVDLDLKLDRQSRIAHYRGRAIELSAKETQLLALFLRSPQQVLTHDDIYQALWGEKQRPSSNAIAAQVRLLRRKLEQPEDEPLIRSVYGRGYRFNVVSPGAD